MASDRGVEWDHGDRIVVGWVLVEALVWTVVVEVPRKFVEDGEGMSLVVDQQPVGALFADAANEPFRVAVRPGCPGRDLDHVESFSEVNTASKAAVNLVSRSRIRKRKEVIRSPRSIRRLRAAWVVQAAVG
jgi:hypothetical protein